MPPGRAGKARDRRALPGLGGSRRLAVPQGALGCARGWRYRSCGVSESSLPTRDAVLISGHAVEQYRYRVKPALDLDAARAELTRLVAVGEITSIEPSWMHAAKPAPFYLLVGDALALPLKSQGGGWIATTCVAQTTYTPTRRAQRAAYKNSKASAKRAARRARP